MGESETDRAKLLLQLATLPKHPESVPINMLVQVEGTPLHGLSALDPLVFVRTIAVARILMPKSRVRLSAGRKEMSDELQDDEFEYVEYDEDDKSFESTLDRILHGKKNEVNC